MDSRRAHAWGAGGRAASTYEALLRSTSPQRARIQVRAGSPVWFNLPQYRVGGGRIRVYVYHGSFLSQTGLLYCRVVPDGGNLLRRGQSHRERTR
eukprot:31121-Chlamydomonas_euryale.AAC.6